MNPSSSSGKQCRNKKRSSRSMSSTIHSLDHDILSSIFSLLHFFDLGLCSTVCKSWNKIINRSQVFQALYFERNRNTIGFRTSGGVDKSLKVYLEDLAMELHRSSLQDGRIEIDKLKAHSVGVMQCRMKMGLLLTGGGDKVVRLWSLERYKCLEEYSVPDRASLVDFDFDESKIVGLLGTRICLWNRNGNRTIFPSREGTFSNGLCMRYIDPEAVVGCDDGTAHVFDMYSRKCSQIIRMNAGPVKSLALTDNHLILSGTSFGNITISSLSADQQVATLNSTTYGDIRTMCFNPSSHLIFAGSTAGFASCWDIRKLTSLWEKRVSPNVVFSMQHLYNDTSRLVVGGIDGVLRVLDQNSGEVLSSCVMESKTLPSASGDKQRIVERKRGRRISNDTLIDSIPKSCRPPITCLAVGMKKVVTTHNDNYITTWKFNPN